MGTKKAIIEGVWERAELENLQEKVGKPSQWGAVSAGIYKALASTHKTLPSAAYSISFDRHNSEPLFIKKQVKTDDIIKFKKSLSGTLMSEINSFWGGGERFTDLGFLHRRGYLLYGPQGTGKSSVINEVVEDIIKRDGIVLYCENPKFFNEALVVFRKAEPNRNLLCVFEDIDAIIKRHGEEEILSVLDGSNMVDRVLNIATTNYPEILDKRIVSRPRRFDRVIKVAPPSKSIRKQYLQAKLPKKSNVDEWVEKTDDLSFAGITEAVISVECLGIDIDKAIDIIKNIEKGHPNSDDFGTKGSLGFSTETTKRPTFELPEALDL